MCVQYWRRVPPAQLVLYDASLICEMTKGFQMSMPSAQGSGTTPLTQDVVIEAFTDGSEADYKLISNQPAQPYVLYNNS